MLLVVSENISGLCLRACSCGGGTLARCRMAPERLSRLQCRILAWLVAEDQRTRGHHERQASGPGAGDGPRQGQSQYQQALALAEALGMRPLVAHCHRALGALYAKIGRPEQARAELSTVIVLYHAMEMTLWLPQAEATLVQIGG